MLVSFLASLAAVPAASASLDTQTQSAVNAMTTEDITNASVPYRHQRTESVNGVTETIEVDGTTMELSRTDDGFRARVSAPTYRTVVRRTPETAVRRYGSARRSYVVTRNRTGEFVRCSTQSGDLARTTIAGAETTRFSGTDRAATRGACKRAQNRLSDQASRVLEQALRLGFIPTKIAITSVNATRESITIRNPVPIPVRLDGWEIRDAAGNSYVLSGRLPAHETRTVFSGEAAEDCSERCWNASVWNDGGDTALIVDDAGEVRDRFQVGG